MTNRTTKSALLMSALALLLCIAMLTGTTFAWFTDEVKSGVNKIVADIDEAVRRHKTVAAPANAARLHCNTPCVRTGKCVSLMRQTEEDMCAGCASEDRICASYVISARQREVGRIKVILVCEELGF